MPDEEKKKIIVDDDWKAEAQREKQRLSEQEEAQARQEPLPNPSFAELINLVAIQAMIALGLVAGPGEQRVPPNLEVAKHFIDMLQVLEDKTKNNLAPEEQKLLDGVVYEMRMRYVQLAGAGTGAPSAG